jgi:hypothetical protein
VVGVCPRCGCATSLLGRDRERCNNTICKWPDPEPGTITLMRYRMKGAADDVLQRLRRVGKWPRVP